MEHCVKNNILKDILNKQRSEVFNLLLNEFDVKSYERWIRAESKAEGKSEDIIELLEDVGEVSDSLRSHIMGQTDLATLNRWLKLAARAQSIEAFERAAGLVNAGVLTLVQAVPIIMGANIGTNRYGAACRIAIF